MERRLKRLEVQNRRLTIAVCALLGLAMLALVGWSQDAQSLTVKEIKVVDDDGEEQAFFGMKGGMPLLQLNAGEDADEGILLISSDEFSLIRVHAVGGGPEAAITVAEDLAMFGTLLEDEEFESAIWTTPDGTYVSAEQGLDAAELTVSDGPAVHISDEEGRGVMCALVEGSAGVFITGLKDQELLLTTDEEKGRPALFMHDADGELVLSLPDTSVSARRK